MIFQNWDLISILLETINMTTFLNFFKTFICEDSLSPFEGVSPSALGFHNTIRDLPDKKPYGFWVDKHGNFIVADMGSNSHVMIGKAVYQNMCKHLGKPFNDSDISGRSYLFMYDNKCIRVVIGGQYMFYQSRLVMDVTPPQMKFLTFVKDLYDIPTMSHEKAPI